MVGPFKIRQLSHLRRAKLFRLTWLVLPWAVVLSLVFNKTLFAETSVLKIGVHPGIRVENDKYLNQIKQVWRDAGVPVEWVYLPSERSLRQAASGHLDGDIARVPRAVENYLALVQVPVPIIKADYYVYILEDKTCFKAEELPQMKPVGAQGERYMQAVYAMSTVGYEELALPENILRMLQKQRAD